MSFASTCLMALFVFTAVSIIVAGSFSAGGTAFEDGGFRFLGKSYELNEKIIVFFKELLEFNRQLFGSFLYDGVKEGVKYMGRFAISLTELAAKAVNSLGR